jgi:hypothetical protein
VIATLQAEGSEEVGDSIGALFQLSEAEDVTGVREHVGGLVTEFVGQDGQIHGKAHQDSWGWAAAM